jgi:streptogramin lyase
MPHILQRAFVTRHRSPAQVLCSVLGAVGLLVAVLLMASGPATAQAPTLLFINDSAGVPSTTDVVPLVFAVVLSAPSTQTVQVGYTTNDADPGAAAPFAAALAGKDYVPTSGVLTFSPGETFKPIIVPVLKRTVRAPNKIFVVLLLTPANAIFGDAFAVGKITNKTPPPETAGTACATEFSNGFVGHPGGMVVGPDGNFWMTEQFDAKLVSFDPRTLKATEYPLPPGTFPHFIMVGPDNNLWFTDLYDHIGMFDLKTKYATMYSTGITPGAVPHFILSAPDGNLYFSEEAEERIPEPGGQNKTRIGQSRIAQFNMQTKKITEYWGVIPPGARLHGMTVGPDGQIWVGLEGLDQLARFNLGTKKLDRFASFTPGSGPHDLGVGPDGNIYVILQDANTIGKVNINTLEVEEFKTSLTREDGNSLVFLAFSADKKYMWFSEFLNDRVGRFELATHKVTEYDCGISAGSAPIGIVLGPDNEIWFSEPVLDTTISGRIGRIVPTP